MLNTMSECDEFEIDEEALSSTECEIAADNSMNPARARKYNPSYDARVNYLVIS